MSINKHYIMYVISNSICNGVSRSREGLLPVLGCKLLLLVLCAANTAIQHKHSYLHMQLANYSSAVPRLVLSLHLGHD